MPFYTNPDVSENSIKFERLYCKSFSGKSKKKKKTADIFWKNGTGYLLLTLLGVNEW